MVREKSWNNLRRKLWQNVAQLRSNEIVTRQMHDCCWPYSKDGHHVSKRGACNKVSFSYNFIPTQCFNLLASAISLLHRSIVLSDCLKADKMVKPTLHLTTSPWLVQSYLSNIFCQWLVATFEPNMHCNCSSPSTVISFDKVWYAKSNKENWKV